MRKLYLALDVETTGFVHYQHEILSICCVLFSMDNEVVDFIGSVDRLIKPTQIETAWRDTLKFVRYDPVKWDLEGVNWQTAATEIKNLLSKAGDDHISLVGHGISFDLRFIDAMNRRHRVKLDLPKDRIDTLALARKAKIETKKKTLDCLSQYFGYKSMNDDLHTAKGDVDRTIYVFRCLDALEYQRSFPLEKE